MALSLLQEAQTARGLAAVRALSAMKQEDDRSSSVSPPITNPTAAGLYPGLHPATASAAMGMFAPQILANQTAAALMAYGFPLGTIRASLASTGIFPHHPALFGAWPPTTPPLSSNSANSNSPPPPASPISPALSTKSAKSAKLNNNYSNMNNNHIVSTTSDLLPQKKATKRKQSSASIKKETMLDLPTTLLNNNDIQIPNSMSPPTPGSSPQSVASMEGGNNITTSSSTTTAKDPSKDKIFTCKICNRSFGYKHVLQNHERTHTGEKPFECPECHKRFTRDHHLKTHMRLHTGEKPYSCSHCDRQFVQVANLRRHLRVHTGERPYSCEICQSRFSDSNQLKAHMLIHNGEKPFECDRCHTKFRRRHHLMHHKCGIVSLPTPAISPSMSFSDHKSHSSEISDESLDLTKTQLNLTKCHQLLSAKPSGLPSSHLISPPINVPMNLSTSSNDQDFMDSIERRHRKSNEIRRLIRMPQQVMPLHSEIPEQTEPEDLSMHSPRSPVSLDDLEDLDDAATLYLKSQRKHLKIPMLKTSLLES